MSTPRFKLKKILFAVVGGIVLVVVAAVAAVQFRFHQELNATYEASSFTIRDLVVQADVALGKRIYEVRSGCIDCHGASLAGAKLMEDPAMGSIWGANITPANLSSWSDEEVARAVRYGIHKTGRSLRFMPAFDNVSMSLSDTAALIAYIRSVPAVDQPSHENTYGPMAKVLSVAGQMPVMFPAKIIDQTRGFAGKPAEGPTHEFGQYLAATCVGCHGDSYVGGKIPGGDPSWPEAANIRLGADSRWTEASFKQMLATGTSPISGQKLRAPMPVHLLQQMDETETTALWLHLSSLK